MFLPGSRNLSRQQKNERGRKKSMTITKRRPNRYRIKNRTTHGPLPGRRPSQLQKRNSNRRRQLGAPDRCEPREVARATNGATSLALKLAQEVKLCPQMIKCG